MQLDRLRYLLGKATKYSNLFLNDDFQFWKKEVVDKRLESYCGAVLTSNVQDSEGREKAIRNLIRYQELKYVTEDIFRTMKQAEESARQKIKEIENS